MPHTANAASRATLFDDPPLTPNGIPITCAPADLSAGLVVTARTVAEVLAGWVGVPAEALLD